MAQASQGRISCPHCGKHYRWKAELAGKKVTCKCGQKMRLPSESGGEAEALGPPPAPADPGESTYGLDMTEDDPAANKPRIGAAAIIANQGRCPNCNNPARPDTVICINCGYNIQAGHTIETHVGEDITDDAELAHPAQRDLNTIKNRPGAAEVIRNLEKEEAKHKASSSTGKVVAVVVLLLLAGGSITFSLLFFL
ncbi:MAG: hypothetical protein WD009_04370 [Phycisphaeraceae bacterium]